MPSGTHKSDATKSDDCEAVVEFILTTKLIVDLIMDDPKYSCRDKSFTDMWRTGSFPHT